MRALETFPPNEFISTNSTNAIDFCFRDRFKVHKEPYVFLEQDDSLLQFEKCREERFEDTVWEFVTRGEAKDEKSESKSFEGGSDDFYSRYEESSVVFYIVYIDYHDELGLNKGDKDKSVFEDEHHRKEGMREEVVANQKDRSYLDEQASVDSLQRRRFLRFYIESPSEGLKCVEDGEGDGRADGYFMRDHTGDHDEFPHDRVDFISVSCEF